MKLYDHPLAPNPRRVRIFLAEKGLDVPREEVDIFKRVNREPAFLKKNPFGGIPVLELDDGTCIAESVAICRYFEGLHPEPPLFGRGPREAAEVEMWNRRVELILNQALGLVWIHGSPLTAQLGPQIKENVEPARKRAANFFAELERNLASRPFIAGEELSIADITALCAMDFGNSMIQVVPDPELRSIARWHTAMSARPSAKA